MCFCGTRLEGCTQPLSLPRLPAARRVLHRFAVASYDIASSPLSPAPDAAAARLVSAVSSAAAARLQLPGATVWPRERTLPQLYLIGHSLGAKLSVMAAAAAGAGAGVVALGLVDPVDQGYDKMSG